MKALSIIIPTYNVEKYIRHCLNSCLQQNISEEEYEIIVVNDGSQDNSLCIAEEIAMQHMNIHIVSQTNAGLSAARNKGLSMAEGEYIWFVDADDSIENNILQQITETCRAGYDLISLGWGFFYESHQVLPQLHDIKIHSGLEILEKAPYPMGAQFYIYKKQFLDKYDLHFMEGIFHEDNEFTPRMLYFAEKAVYIKQVIYYYTVRQSGSILSTPNKKKAYDLLLIAQSTINFAQAHVIPKKRYIYYNLTGIAINNSIRNIKQHSRKEQQHFYQELKLHATIFDFLLYSNNTKYIIEALLCKISLLLYYKTITAL